MALTEPESPLIRRSTIRASIKSVRKASENEAEILHEVACSRSIDKSVKEKPE